MKTAMLSVLAFILFVTSFPYYFDWDIGRFAAKWLANLAVVLFASTSKKETIPEHQSSIVARTPKVSFCASDVLWYWFGECGFACTSKKKKPFLKSNGQLLRVNAACWWLRSMCNHGKSRIWRDRFSCFLLGYLCLEFPLRSRGEVWKFRQVTKQVCPSFFLSAEWGVLLAQCSEIGVGHFVSWATVTMQIYRVRLVHTVDLCVAYQKQRFLEFRGQFLQVQRFANVRQTRTKTNLNLFPVYSQQRNRPPIL